MKLTTLIGVCAVIRTNTVYLCRHINYGVVGICQNHMQCLSIVHHLSSVPMFSILVLLYTCQSNL